MIGHSMHTYYALLVINVHWRTTKTRSGIMNGVYNGMQHTRDKHSPLPPPIRMFYF